MADVQVTFKLTPDPEQEDDGDNTGLTEEAFNEVMDGCMALGGHDIEIEKVS